MDRIVLGLIASALGLATFAIGLRIWTIGDSGWVVRSSIAGESRVTLSYVLVLFVFIESFVLLAFWKAWRRGRKSKGRFASGQSKQLRIQP